MNICSYIDHTLLKPTATYNDLNKLCEEALHYHFAAVCIPPPFVIRAKIIVKDSGVKTATVIGFPFGYSIVESKLAETEQAIIDGVDELDVVINLIALKNGDWKYLEEEVKRITTVVHSKEKIIKVIIESGVLTDDEIIKCCEVFGKIGVDFLKTSTGYAEKGAGVEAVSLMKKNLPASVKIKASGGIRTYEFAKKLIDAGASRIGCSSSAAIVTEAKLSSPVDY
jgi:deoxyribose-phosphate aldolase